MYRHLTKIVTFLQLNNNFKFVNISNFSEELNFLESNQYIKTRAQRGFNEHLPRYYLVDTNINVNLLKSNLNIF